MTRAAVTVTELLPCPFCGSRATVEKWHEGAWVDAFCTNLKCAARISAEGSRCVFKRWNRRALHRLALTKPELKLLSGLLRDAYYDYGYNNGEHTAAEKRTFDAVRAKVVQAAKGK